MSADRKDNFVTDFHFQDSTSQTFIHHFFYICLLVCAKVRKNIIFTRIFKENQQKMSSIMEIEERIRIIKDAYNDLRARKIVKTQEEFAQLLGVSAKSLSAAKNGVKNYCTDSFVSKVQGTMRELERSVSISNSPGSNVINGDNNNMQIGTESGRTSLDIAGATVRMVPTIPIHAYRAIDFNVMEYFRDNQNELHMSPIVMQFPGTDCYYFVNSDDMSPNLQTNDLLCLSRLPEDARVTNGDLCIINTRFQGILERFVYDDGDALILKSTQARWTDMRIPKDEIFSVFRILGGIRTNI